MPRRPKDLLRQCASMKTRPRSRRGPSRPAWCTCQSGNCSKRFREPHGRPSEVCWNPRSITGGSYCREHARMLITRGLETADQPYEVAWNRLQGGSPSDNLVCTKDQQLSFSAET
jgi:hypothetical protein